MESGSCEFNAVALRPTYRLLINVPGCSNAFITSGRPGPNREIADRAHEPISGEDRHFEDVAQNLEQSRQKLEAERWQVQEQSAETRKISEEVREYRERLECETAEEIEQARECATQLAARTRAQADTPPEELEEVERQDAENMIAEQRVRMKTDMRNTESASDPMGRKKPGTYVPPRPLEAGDDVLILDIDKEGTVIGTPTSDGKKVFMQAGITKTGIPVENLRLLEQKTQNRKAYRDDTRDVLKRSNTLVMTEVDVRGGDSIEAVMSVDRAIDLALLSGIHQLTIIHGKGIGMLHTTVQQHLRRHSSVRTYRLDAFGKGKSGVTIVGLKQAALGRL